MIPPNTPCSRRRFLAATSLWTALSPMALRAADLADGDEVPLIATAPPPPPVLSPTARASARVAVVRCRSFGNEYAAALRRSFDLLGGVQRLVKDKTVTVKINLTGTDFNRVFNRPVGDSYMTHPDTAMSLASEFFRAGAKRIRFVESTNRIEKLEQTVVDAGWDVRAFDSLGRVEWENTRNMGSSKAYAHLKVASGGHLFSSFEVNRSYTDNDVLVSLCKLKNHLTCGVTLALKNMFGMTPNALYGGQAPSENGVDGRGPLHNRRDYKGSGMMPGEIRFNGPDEAGHRVPRIVCDLAEARPIHLSIIDGVVSMKGGEGPWAPEVGFIAPGVLIVGLNPVSTDAVGTAVMGYADPRALRRTPPFHWGDNHLLMAEQRGLGALALQDIEVVGERIQDVICRFG